jgi:Mg2+/Co2+ transporter CorC
MLRHVLDEADLSRLRLEDIMRPPVVVPLTKKVDEMFDFFKARKARAATVLNEFGGVEGFITMADVLAFIFGDISGEVNGQGLYQERDANVYEVPGNMKLTDFNNLTNFGIEDPRMTTIGGVAFRHLDRLPQVGDRVVVEGIVVTVLEMDVHRIERVRVARGAALEEGEEGPVASATDSPPETETEETTPEKGEGPPWPEETVDGPQTDSMEGLSAKPGERIPQGPETAIETRVSDGKAKE